MPVQPTHPDGYAKEPPSTERTIAGVSTSVAAFVGAAKDGPINQAVHVLSFADFESGFGGLDAGSELSYSVRQFFLNGGKEAWVVRVAEDAATGNEPVVQGDVPGAFIGDRLRQGIHALDQVDIFNLLCLPGITDSGVLADADAYCRGRRAFLIVDAPPAAVKPADMVDVIQGTALLKSDHAAVYYPWIQIGDPLAGGRLRTTAPCGTIAGLYARTDAARGVWKAPSGTEATLNSVQALTYALTDLEISTLDPLGVNCLRFLPVFGPVSWGARTLRGADQPTSEWNYVPVRRFALYLEDSLFRGTQWIVFEPNDEQLWAQIRLIAGDFMYGLFCQGAFQGKTPNEAYLVRCDQNTTTQDDVNRGIVNIVVGFAPLRPAELVFIQIQQLAGQIQS